MDNKPSVCLAMIVKNNSSSIRRCLESIKPYIDYWVIHDTGSTDDTKKIIGETLEGIPGVLEDQKWVNFGVNRSKVLDVARNKTDWVISLDADYEFVGHLDNLENQIADRLNIMFPEHGNRLPLLFNNRMVWQYEGACHEVLSCVEPTSEQNYDDFVIIHHSHDSQDAHRRFERNLELLLADTPSPRRCFYLGETYRCLNQKNEAYYWYQKYLEEPAWYQEVFWAKYHSQLMLGDNPDCWNPANLWDAYYGLPERVETLYLLQQYYRHKGNYYVAIATGLLAKSAGKPEGLFIENAIYDYLVDFELSIAYARIGQYDMAESYNKKVLEQNPPTQYVTAIANNRTYYV